MAKDFTSREEDYSKWYNELVVKADLAENSAVRGCMVIKPYGFSLEEKAVRRAGMDYWKHVQLSQYDSQEIFLNDRSPPRESLYFFEEHGAQSVYAPNYVEDSYLIFGCESKGLSTAILNGLDDRVFKLPMRNPVVRSLNLANVATAFVYQAVRTELGG